MFPVLQVGPLAIQASGLVILLGLWAGLLLSERFSQYRDVSPTRIYNLVLIGLIAGIIGGRLAYALRYPQAFTSSPISLVSLNPGLFSIEDGILIGILASWIYGYRTGMRIWPTLDALTPFFMVLLVANGLAHLASGNAFGSETQLPWGIELWGAVRHPSQIYETILSLVILFLLWPFRHRFRNWKPGIFFLTFACLGAASALFLEAFRGDSLLILNGIRLTQVFAWIVLAASLLGIYRLNRDSISERPF
jgi:phosphatidylglycerol:prolipoprotein diacylglycerol transferase